MRQYTSPLTFICGWRLPSCHSKESGCHPGTVLCVPKGLLHPHIGCRAQCVTVMQHTVTHSGDSPKSVANWELQQDTLNVKICDRLSIKWSSPARGHTTCVYPWVFLHFPNPSRSPIPEPGNGGELQMAGKGQVY